MIRAVGYLISEAIWSLVFRIAPPQRREDDTPDTAADTAARTQWIRAHRHPTDGGAA